jgi:hypothetical protein
MPYPDCRNALRIAVGHVSHTFVTAQFTDEKQLVVGVHFPLRYL